MGLFDWFRKKRTLQPTGASLVADARRMAKWVADALNQSEYNADFSLESLREIDRFFDEQSRDGVAVPGGLLAEQLGSRIFALGSYVGECIIRHYGGQWQADGTDPEGEINIQVVIPGGAVIWPVQRVMKRFRNGAEDGIYAYGRLVRPESA
jgi:hypothetical protein